MKKLIAVVSVLIIATTISYGSGLTASLASYPINLNHQRLEATPLNVNGSTYLPVRTVSEALGVDIGWTGSSVEIQTVDIEKLKEACVMIYADDGKTQVQGSGVYTDFDEVTSALHLTADNRTNLKTSEGYKLTVEDSDSTLDIMTLDSTTEIQPVKIGDSDEVQVGDKVIIVGSPQGKNDTVAYGTVSSPEVRGMVVISNGLGKPTKGISGGAAFDMDGDLIGILVAEDPNNPERFLVIPINDIREEL